MRHITFIIFCLSYMISFSCNKILEEKSDKSLSTPNSISSLQEMLDYANVMDVAPSWSEGASDNLYIEDSKLDQYGQLSIDAYTWLPILYDGGDWPRLYQTIYVANTVIEEANKIKPSNSSRDAWKNVLGSALFYRAQSYFDGALTFCLGFDTMTANKNWGMVLRLSSDFNLVSERVSLMKTYDQIINDLIMAKNLLPLYSSTIYRPSKCAAYGLLSRVYLSMREYNMAGLYADSCLQNYNRLLDYNSLDLSVSSQFNIDNPEVIFTRFVSSFALASASPKSVLVDSALYEMYDDNDLRKFAFFKAKGSGYFFKGSYSSSYTKLFAGIATDEMYLIRAECLARKGLYKDALNDLNKILIKRWKTDDYTPYTVDNVSKVLDLILKERRKELLFRCLRWMDIKRLNLDGYNIILKRVVHGKEFVLAPNSKAYAIPIPATVVSSYGVPQNDYN